MADADLEAVRRAYARQMVASTGESDPRLEAALAVVRREDFLGSPPWTILRIPGERQQVGRDDVAVVYADVLVALDASRGVNNGSPSLHALMLHHLAVARGDVVLHVGAGTGYYTAILAELAGPDGRVTAVEYDATLAEAARRNLKPWPNVTVIRGDGAAGPTEPTQRIYVNFAVGEPADAWLDQLTIGGRLVFVLGAAHPQARGDERNHTARGAVLRVTRTPSGFAVQHVSAAHFICAEGLLAGDIALQERLFHAFNAGDINTVASLHRDGSRPERAWFRSPRWSLSPDPPSE